MSSARGRRRSPDGFPPLALVLLLVTVVTAARPPLAWAGTEEWSTFNPEAQESDDESLIDHFLTQPQRAWRDEWEHSPLAFRTSEGCLTSGQWFIDSDLKLRTALGKRAEFRLLFRQLETDAESFNYTDLQFRFPTRWGVPGAWFRPLYDKSRQDFSLTWDFGADTTAEQLQLAFTLEDVFNNFWAFRQTQVGGLSEPYLSRPYEPGIRWVSRHAWVRAEVQGRWLTPSRKRVMDFSQPVPDRITTIWGTLGEASVELYLAGLEWDLATRNQQAFSTDAPIDGSTGNAQNFRRRWAVETALRRRITPELTAEVRYLYQDRDARRGPPFGPSGFGALDRMGQAEVRWQVRPSWAARIGGMYDRVNVGEFGPYHPFSYGTRTESRTYLGLDVRFGNVTVSGVEGIEMDPERYDVWLWHDKGFLSMQARF
jgi:hypothetical protein